MYIDTHLHLEKEDSFEEVLQKAKEKNVQTLIISGCSRKGIDDALYIATKCDNIFVTIGYHPDVASEVTSLDLVYLEEQLKHDKVVGLGEIGLDYHYGKENMDKQKELFKKQLELAHKYDLPVVVHTRDAIQDTYDILKEYDGRCVLHCFSESIEMARLFLKKGFYFGIGGVLTFKNSKLYQVVRELPLENIVLETDSPYLSPEPYRGLTNGPWNIPIIAQKIAEIKEMDANVIASMTTLNASRLFDLEKKL